MERMVFPEQSENWQFLLTFLPPGWREQARELGAIKRYRKFDNPEVLLRTLLIHLAMGCSLRETATRAKQGQITQVSDVALLKRLKAAGSWLRWMAAGVMQTWVTKPPEAIFGEQLRIRIIDGSTIREPGSTGSTWRLHYSILLPTLQCNEVHITSPKIGESFKRYQVRPGDLFLGDRGYAHRERSVAERFNSRLKEAFGGANVMVRGAEKVRLHLMFGVIALFADQLLKLIG